MNRIYEMSRDYAKSLVYRPSLYIRILYAFFVGILFVKVPVHHKFISHEGPNLLFEIILSDLHNYIFGLIFGYLVYSANLEWHVTEKGISLRIAKNIVFRFLFTIILLSLYVFLSYLMGYPIRRL